MRRYLEPSTDVPAVEDWSTAMILAEARSMARVGSVGTAVLLVATLGIAVFLPGSTGNVATVVLLGLLDLTFALTALVSRAEWATARRGQLDRPWRRCPATVAVTDEEYPTTQRLLIFDEAGTLVVRGMLADVEDLVLDQQELFLCGPDDRGRVVLRVAGLCRLFQARVDVKAEVRPRERTPHLSGRPLDDPAVARAFRYFRWGTRPWVWPAIPAALGGVLVWLSVSPSAPAGLAVGGLLLLGATLALPVLSLGPFYRQAVAGLRAAARWTAVPVTLFPWEPGHEVAGLAHLPGGFALVQFPFPNADVIANIADTGTMWLAGSPGDEAVAVGVPRVPVLTLGLFQPDRDHPDDKPQPWLLRGNDPSLRTIPTLTR